MPAFSIPNIPNFNSTTPNQMPVLFVPNIPFLRRFADGDLGIAKKIVTSLHQRSLSQIKSKDVLESYLKLTGVKLPGNLDQYFKDGKFNPPPTLSVQKTGNNLGGLEALERSLIQSIFETQKPYFEIAKLVIDHFVIIEDIVAHVLGLAGRSKKPRGNPRALGYQGNQSSAGGGVKKGMGTLNAFRAKPSPKTKLSETNNPINLVGVSQSPTPDVTTFPVPPPYIFVTQSVVYSTGQFDENVQYTYIYKDIFEQWIPNIEDVSNELEDEDETGKDDLLVLAVYDSNFIPVPLGDPRIDRYLDWIKPKYRNNIWPQLKPGEDFDYIYAKPPIKTPLNFFNPQEERVGGPPEDDPFTPLENEADGWGIKIYGDLDGPFIDVEGESKAIKKGQKAIALNSAKTITLFNQYKTYYMEYTAREIDKKLAGEPPEYIDEKGNTVNLKQSTLDDMNERLSDFGPEGNITIQIEGLLSSNFMTQTVRPGNTIGLPQATQRGDKFFYKVNRNGSQVDIEFPAYAFQVAKNGQGVWMDPEAEYDMKLIKCDASRDIRFEETVGAPERKAKIRRFIKKSLVINVANQQKIGFFVPVAPANENDIRITFDKYENLSALNVDWFLDNPTVALPPDQKLYFSIAEAGVKKYQVTPDSQLNLQLFQSSIPSNFLNTFQKTANEKYKFVPDGDRYRLVGSVDNLYKTFYKRDYLESTNSFANTYFTIDHDNNPSTAKIRDIMDLLVGSQRYTQLLQQFPNEQALATKIQESSFDSNVLIGNLNITNVRFKNKTVYNQGRLLWKMTYLTKTVYLTLQDGNFYYIGIKKDYDFNLNVPSDGVLRTLSYNIETDSVSSINNVNSSNLIRIDDYSTGTRKSRVITNVNIPNNHLRGDGPFSNGEYGTPGRGESSDENMTQQLGQIYRYQKYIDDVETFYIVEAVLKSKNKNELESDAGKREKRNTNPTGAGSGGGGGGGGGSYTWRNIFSVIPKFIRLVVRLATKLFPTIQKFLNLIRNPAKFITDIIVAKLGDDFGRESPKFGFFSKDFLDQLIEVKQYCEQLKNVQGKPELINQVKQNLELYLNTSLLKNYVWIGDDGVGKFVLDGTSLLTLFGSAPILAGLPSISFGIQTNFSSLITPQPKVPIKLIFSVNRAAKSSDIGKDGLLGNTIESLNQQIKNSSLLNNGLPQSGPLYIKNEIRTDAAGVQTIEQISIQYSTGVFREDVKYEYIYLTEEIENLVEAADKLIDIGDSASISEATRLLEKAATLDPKNKFIQDKLGTLRKLQGVFFTQPLLDFMLNFVALPLKVIIGIIKYILDFFKSLSNPFSLPGKIIEFLTFKWLIDFFNPTDKNSMFAMAGVLFDIPTFFQVWLPSLTSGAKQKFDMNEILQLPWVTFPTFTLEEYFAKTFGAQLTAPPIKFPIPTPVLIVSSLLCLIEAIINSFIDLVWAIFGMVDPLSGRWIVIKPPYLKLCKDSNQSLSPKDIVKLMNATVPDLSNPVTGEGGVAQNPSVTDSQDLEEETFDFAYNIFTSDGRNVMNLNREELDKFMEANQDLTYTFNFDDSE